MLSYKYRALEPGEIRLLNLNPLSKASDELFCSIFHHTLTKPAYVEHDGSPAFLEHDQDYVALSYHWGSDPKTPHQLFIDEPHGTRAIIKITRTLNSFLRLAALRNYAEVLWIDAICIDQVDNSVSKEKEEQIKLMPDIYRIAKKVHVYLGPYVDGDLAGIQLLYTLADYVEFLDETHQSGAGGGLNAAIANGLFLPPASDKQWVSMRAFLRRPWFRRMWVLQEFVHATEIVMTCGAMEINWLKLFLATMSYTRNKDLLGHDYKPRIWEAELTSHRDKYREAQEGARTFLAIAGLRMRARGWLSPEHFAVLLESAPDPGPPLRSIMRSYIQLEASTRNYLLKRNSEGTTFTFRPPEFLELTNMTRGFFATYPVDRLYALLSLACDAGELETIYSQEQTISVVTRRFALHFIAKGNMALVLEKAGIRSNKSTSSSDEPSWIPDWTALTYMDERPIGLTTLSRLPEGMARTLGHATEEYEIRLYRASLGREMEAHADADQQVLTVKANLVDTVAVVTPGNLTYGAPFYLEMVKLSLGSQYYTGESTTDALWRTLTANRAFHGDRAPDYFREEFDRLLEYESRIFLFQYKGLVFVILAGMPFAMLAMYRLPIVAHGAILALLAIMGVLTPLASGAILGMIPILCRLHFLIVLPVLYLIAFVGVPYFSPLAMMRTVHCVGLTLKRTRAVIPEDCSQVWKSMVLTENQYRLAITEGGRLALVPLLTLKGDTVVIIHGCETASIVRATGKEHCARLVGESYVHGMMEGQEMLRGHEDIDLHLV